MNADREMVMEHYDGDNETGAAELTAISTSRFSGGVKRRPLQPGQAVFSTMACYWRSYTRTSGSAERYGFNSLTTSLPNSALVR